MKGHMYLAAPIEIIAFYNNARLAIHTAITVLI